MHSSPSADAPRALRFSLNGLEVREDTAAPTTTLLQWLRGRRHTGTKEGCAEGDCGACTVAILDPASGRWRAINSCLVLLPMVDGCHVVTVEGLAHGEVLHPAQQAMVQALGSQCGYCTPGFVMSLFEACYRSALDRGWRLDDQICGNLCRCTGYRPIRDALASVAGQQPDDRFLAAAAGPHPAPAPLRYEAAGQRFDAPDSLEHALALLQLPGIRIVAGATDLGLQITQRHDHPPHLLSLDRIAALRGITHDGGEVQIGATTPLSELEDWSEQQLPILHRMLRYFGSRQIKHRGTLGGNLCNASPIGDLAPVLLALDADAVLCGPEGQRTIPLSSFFVGYRDTALAHGELLIQIRLRPPPADARLGAYKVSRRRELDISAVSAAMQIRLDDQGRVALARLAFGGMAATPLRAAAAEAALLQQPWSEQAVIQAAGALEQDFTPLSDPRGSSWFRRTLARNLLLGFYEETQQQPFMALPERHTGTLVLDPPVPPPAPGDPPEGPR